MNITILVSLGIAALLLLALYLLCRRFPVLGEGIGFLCILIARPLVTLQLGAETAAALFARVSEGSLNYPPNVSSDVWQGVFVIARIILFGACSIILAGDLYNTLQSTPLLFGGAGSVDLPGSFAIPSALLFVMTGALYGMTALEAANITPYGSHLFPTMTDKVKKWVGISCLVGFLLSLMFAVAFWAFRGYYLLSPDDAGVLAIPILALVGLLLTGASVLALWGLVVGLTGVVTLLCWLLSRCCSVAAGMVSLIPSLLDVMTIHLTQGERSVYESYEPGAPYQVPNTWFHRRSSLSHNGKGKTVSSASVQEDQANTSGFAISTHTEKEVLSMNTGFVGITLNGVLGSQLLQGIQVNFTSCKKLVRCSGRVDYRLSPTQSVGFGSDCSAATYDLMGNKIVDAFLGVSSPFLIHSLDAAEGLRAIPMLQDIKRRLPQATQVVITAVNEADLAFPAAQAFVKAMAKLHQEGGATTVLLGTDSALVRSLGNVKFHEYVTRLFADMVVADMHSGNNLGAVAVFNELSHRSAFVSLALATAAVASGSTPFKWSWLKFFTNKAVTGNVEDMLSQALAVTKQVMGSSDTSALGHPVSRTTPCYLVFDTPLSLADRSFHQFEEHNHQQVKENFPYAQTMTISGSPVPPLSGSSSPFRIGVNCLYPVTLPVVETPQPLHKEVTPKEENQAASVTLPADTVPLDVAVPSTTAHSANGQRNGRGRGRSGVKKEK